MPPVVCDKHTGVYLKRIPLLRYQTYQQALDRSSDLTVWCTQINALAIVERKPQSLCDFYVENAVRRPCIHDGIETCTYMDGQHYLYVYNALP
jgi:hypothetical protein